MTESELDRLFPDMETSDTGRLRFFAALADTELFVLLEREADGAQIEPRLFPVDGREVVLGFDDEARLAEFADGPAPYVALPGRIIAQMLGEAELGLGLNLGVAPSSTLLEPDALRWLTETLGQSGPDSTDARLREVSAPGKVPDMLLEALGARLTQGAAGLASHALLAGVTYDDGGRGHVLALIGASARAEGALARMVSEALTFSGVEAGFLDVAFLRAGHAAVARLEKVAMRFDIPQPQDPPVPEQKAPGSDPDTPPRLR
jgi:hypothetical protein